MISGIYKIKNIINNKFYIGSAKDMDKRWYDHRRELTLNIHRNPKLQNSWNKHGEDKFIFEMIEEVSPEKLILFEREQFYLDLLKPYIREVGYNICPVAGGGDNITHNPNKDEFIEKMKLINKGENNGMYGKTHTDESIEKQKNKAIGRYTLEWFINRHGIRIGKRKFNERRIMLKNRTINYNYDNGQTGISKPPLSEYSRKKITDTKLKMKIIKKDLIDDIKMDKYTRLQLCEKYDISESTVKYYKKMLKHKL